MCYLTALQFILHKQHNCVIVSFQLVCEKFSPIVIVIIFFIDFLCEAKTLSHLSQTEHQQVIANTSL